MRRRLEEGLLPVTGGAAAVAVRRDGELGDDGFMDDPSGE